MNKKKILIIGSNDKFSLEKMYFRAFKSLGNKVSIYNVYNIQKNNLISKFLWKYLKFLFFIIYRFKLLKFFQKLNNKKFDIIIVFKGIFLDLATLEKCKNITKDAFWANVFSDDPFNIKKFNDISNSNVLKSINFYDFYFIWSKELRTKLINFSTKKKIFFLPFANDDFVHKEVNTKKEIKFDLSFVGTADKKRFDFLKNFKKFKVIIAGNNWNRYNFDSNFKIIKKAINASQNAKVIANSKISLNLLRKQNEGSHNMKTFEIPAMGGLLVTKKTSEQNRFFPNNKASVMFSSKNDLNRKIKYIIKNYSKYEKIRKTGLKIAKKNTYRDRAKYILKCICSS